MGYRVDVLVVALVVGGVLDGLGAGVCGRGGLKSESVDDVPRFSGTD